MIGIKRLIIKRFVYNLKSALHSVLNYVALNAIRLLEWTLQQIKRESFFSDQNAGHSNWA